MGNTCKSDQNQSLETQGGQNIYSCVKVKIYEKMHFSYIPLQHTSNPDF